MTKPAQTRRLEAAIAARKGPLKKATHTAETVVNLTIGAQRLFSQAKDFWRENYAYSVIVSEKDQLYSEVHEWLLRTSPQDKHRSLSVSSKSSRNNETEDSDSDLIAAISGSSATRKRQKNVKPLMIRFNDSSTRTVSIEGHKVRVRLQTPDIPETSQMRESVYAKIEFVAQSYPGQQAILRQLEKLNAERSTSRKAVLRMVNSWGSWNTRSDIPPRTMDSVSLPAEQKDRIVNDLRSFLDAEEQYNKLAIPWHRGYMFHGPPGTGKTSLVKALANEFNLDLWYISLSDLKAESSLLGLLADVGPRSLLLLEDIDTMRIAHDRDGSEQGQISMSSLLNTLDGVATPHGLITIMTTNRFEILDPALTRAGRMDLVEMLDYPSLSTLAGMFQHFYGKAPEWDGVRAPEKPIEGLSTAQIAEVMKRHMGDPEEASKAILAEIEKIAPKAKVGSWTEARKRINAEKAKEEAGENG